MVESDRLQPGQPVAAAGAAGKGRELVADQLAAAVGEDRWPVDKARPLLLLTAGGEPPHTTAVHRHAAENHRAAVAGGIGAPQSAADLGNATGRNGTSV